MTNEEKAREIGKKYQTPCHGIGDCEFEAYQSAIEAMEWKDEQHAQEKQQLIDKAMEVICNGCTQKAECEFNNWKTCSTKNELIKAMKGE